jgi:hypothetical protein
MTEFEDLRGDDDDDFDNSAFADDFGIEEEAARAGGPLGMSSVELLIVAVFVVLNAAALGVILLIITGVFAI